MPIINRVAEFHDEVTAWRRHIHENPGLQYDVEETAAFAAEKLRAFGCDEVVEGIGRTGVVGLIRGNKPGPTIGLRADMDALPIHEKTGAAYASKTPGKMHACGHDGHTAMLLGAAKYLSETRDFAGTVAVIFQPAEEGGAGGKAMCDDDMMARFDIAEVYGMHNMPGLPVGEFAIRSGACMAGTDEFHVTVTGLGSHAAQPHNSVDPILIATQMVQALQGIVARNVDPLKSAVLTVTAIHGGKAHNVIPQEVKFWGTVRTLEREVRDHVIQRLQEVCTGIAAAHGAKADVTITEGYPVTVNHETETGYAADVARSVAGESRVNENTPAVMGGEDFSFMLEERPGAFIFMGNGNTASLHHEEYDFNDEAIPVGVSYWATLVEHRLGRAA